MSNFARIVNNVAVDVSSNPEEQFHPSIAAEFVPVPDQVHRGWRLVDDEWQAPEPEPEPVTALRKRVSPVEFKLLFTPQERVAIQAARANQPILDDWYTLIEDPRLVTVNLESAATQDGLQFLQTLGLITEDRRLQILQGYPD